LVDTRHVVVVPIQRRDGVEHRLQAVDAIHDEILVDFNLQIAGNVSAESTQRKKFYG